MVHRAGVAGPRLVEGTQSGDALGGRRTQFAGNVCEENHITNIPLDTDGGAFWWSEFSASAGAGCELRVLRRLQRGRNVEVVFRRSASAGLRFDVALLDEETGVRRHGQFSVF